MKSDIAFIDSSILRTRPWPLAETLWDNTVAPPDPLVSVRAYAILIAYRACTPCSCADHRHT